VGENSASDRESISADSASHAQLALSDSVDTYRLVELAQGTDPAAFFGLATTLLRRTLIDLARHYHGVYGLGAKHESTGNSPLEPEVGQTSLRFSAPILELDDWTAFHEAIERLPELERETFSLKWYAGLTQRQIGELLGISERTVIRRLIEARTMLSGWLADHETLS
jgi:RNA polymerase sigma factor (sigma-70 family)